MQKHECHGCFWHGDCGCAKKKLPRLPNLVGSETGGLWEKVKHTLAEVGCVYILLSSRYLGDSLKHQKQTTGAKASEAHTGTYTSMGTSRAQVIEAAGLVLNISVFMYIPMHFDSHVNTGDSISCTSLSIWMRILTVISSSALCLLANPSSPELFET